MYYPKFDIGTKVRGIAHCIQGLNVLTKKYKNSKV